MEEALGTTPRRVLLAARDRRRDVVLGDGSLSVCSDGTATCLLDDVTGERLPGTAARLRTVMRLLDALPQCDYVWPSLSARDLDPLTANLEIEAISLAECGKHLQDEVRGPEVVSPLVDILEAVAGASLHDRPIFSVINCTVAPLEHDPEMTRATLELARRGVPIVVMPMPLLGTTAPASLVGTIVVNMAELLSTVVLLQLAAPGCPVVSAPEPALADLRTGLYQCGAPEAFLMTLACLEMSALYGLPTQGGGLGGDGRYPDFQEGAEGLAAALLSPCAGPTRWSGSARWTAPRASASPRPCCMTTPWGWSAGWRARSGSTSAPRSSTTSSPSAPAGTSSGAAAPASSVTREACSRRPCFAAAGPAASPAGSWRRRPNVRPRSSRRTSPRRFRRTSRATSATPSPRMRPVAAPGGGRPPRAPPRQLCLKIMMLPV